MAVNQYGEWVDDDSLEAVSTPWDAPPIPAEEAFGVGPLESPWDERDRFVEQFRNSPEAQPLRQRVMQEHKAKTQYIDRHDINDFLDEIGRQKAAQTVGDNGLYKPFDDGDPGVEGKGMGGMGSPNPIIESRDQDYFKVPGYMPPQQMHFQNPRTGKRGSILLDQGPENNQQIIEDYRRRGYLTNIPGQAPPIQPMDPRQQNMNPLDRLEARLGEVQLNPAERKTLEKLQAGMEQAARDGELNPGARRAFRMLQQRAAPYLERQKEATRLAIEIARQRQREEHKQAAGMRGIDRHMDAESMAEVWNKWQGMVKPIDIQHPDGSKTRFIPMPDGKYEKEKIPAPDPEKIEAAREKRAAAAERERDRDEAAHESMKQKQAPELKWHPHEQEVDAKISLKERGIHEYIGTGKDRVPNPEFAPAFSEEMTKRREAFNDQNKLNKYKRDLLDWQRDAVKAIRDGKQPPEQPKDPFEKSRKERENREKLNSPDSPLNRQIAAQKEQGVVQTKMMKMEAAMSKQNDQAARDIVFASRSLREIMAKYPNGINSAPPEVQNKAREYQALVLRGMKMAGIQ